MPRPKYRGHPKCECGNFRSRWKLLCRRCFRAAGAELKRRVEDMNYINYHTARGAF